LTVYERVEMRLCCFKGIN